MAFDSGRVSFCRLRVTGDAPQHVDDAMLSILREHRFQETEIGTPDEVEFGFTTGVHILDTQFTYEKNGFGSPTSGGGIAMFAMRLDTHKVPSEIKQAYRKMNEQAVAAGNPSGFASRAQKREAGETAANQIREDLAAGRFRKSKAVPVLWDFKEQVIYCGATSSAATEHLARLMRTAFSVDLEMISGGTLAGHLLRAHGHQRDYEDFRPSPFTKPPAAYQQAQDDAEGGGGGDGGGGRDASTPIVPWVTQSVDLKDFLGNEFLLWLWWRTETAEGEVAGHWLAIDKSLDMDCAWDVGGKQSLRSERPTKLIEAGDALRTGKWPRKVGLILSDGEKQWELSLQGDKMHVGSAALPEIEDAQSPRELIEARLELIREMTAALDKLYAAFLNDRVGSGWPTRRESIGQWVRQRVKT